MESVPAYVLETYWNLLMDIYLAIGFAPLVLGIFAVSRLRVVRYLVLIGGALALSSCLSLKLGSNDKPRPTAGQSAGASGRSAGTLDVANSMAEASGGG
jgi:hypothetical protein